ncbi:hypothetical protein [Spiroplasma endosymbiont of Eupeodes luniger]|uniref:hypothetical protein n=1 Tax=Spiroplasma endosymbiont of Eupeodes luniger TaxID=3066300 RepID=UPI0030CB317D
MLVVTFFSLGICTNLVACSSQTMTKDFIKEEITNNQLLNEEVSALKRKIAILVNDFQDLIKKNNVTKERIEQLEQKLREKIAQQESEIAQLIEYVNELTKLVNSFGSGELAYIAKLLKDNATLEDKLHHIRTEMARLLNKQELIAKNDALKVKIVSTYLEQFNDNNRFDLRGLNTLHKRVDVLNKVEEALKMKFPKIFKHTENLRVWDKNKFLKDEGFDKFQDGQIGLNINFKIGNKESDWIRVYFKNIEKSDDNLFNEVKKYLEQFNMENPFAL